MANVISFLDSDSEPDPDSIMPSARLTGELGYREFERHASRLPGTEASLT